jgi:nucleoside-diphosphate-sugar epimerase
MKIISGDQPGFQVFNVGHEERYSIRQFAELVSSVTGATVLHQFDPDFLHSPRNAIYPNIEKLKSLGWQSEWEIEAAIEKTVHWMKS